MLIIKRYWTKFKFHNTGIPSTSWYERTHEYYGYFLLGFIPIYIVKKEVN